MESHNNSPFFINTYMGEIDKNNLDLDFIITDDIEKVRNDETVSDGAIIYERGEKKNLYIGDERVTDNFNIRGNKNTPTIIDGKKLGDFKNKSMSEVVEEIMTSDLNTGTGGGVRVFKSSDFDIYSSESDAYIPTNSFIVDDSMELERPVLHNNAVTIEGTYLDIMMNTIRSLQSEITRLKNSFNYGIVSYKNESTSISKVLDDYSNVQSNEPLWALDPDMMSEIMSQSFNNYLDTNHNFYIPLDDGEIDSTVSEQLTFRGTAIWPKLDDTGVYETFKNLKDSKIIGYLVSSSKDIWVNLVDPNNDEHTLKVYLGSSLDSTVSKYGIMFVISRKNNVENQLEGYNYFYVSIMNYLTGKKMCEGYLKPDGTFGFNSGATTRYDLDYRYIVKSIEVKDLTLYRMKFYTKYEDFIDGVIPSQPEDDYKYEAAHIAIRSVKDKAMLERVEDLLIDTELIWNKKDKTLHIKSDGKIYTIGAIKSDEGDSDNNDDNMTNREIVDALVKMGIVINAEYDENGDIVSLENLKLNNIQDFTMINGDTGKEYVFGVDAYGSLVGKDKDVDTIEKQLEKKNITLNLKNGVSNVRGFSAEYLRKIAGNVVNEPNGTGDYGVNSDRLRISSFYAPLTTDDVHGCTHSFIELENSSEVDIPLTGVYLHFYNPVEDKVYHLELDGIIPAGGTYLVRGKKHTDDNDVNAFIKVSTYDKEWYENGKLVSFEEIPVKTIKTTGTDGTTVETVADDSLVKNAYRFCLTYSFANLEKNDILGEIVSADIDSEHPQADFPNKISDSRFIDSCSFSSFGSVSSQTGTLNPWYLNGKGGTGIVITKNTMFRNTFALDPAKQAFNGFTTKDGSRVRYNKAQDIQIVDLSKEYIGYPNSDEIALISRYTPKASYEHKNVMTDKSQLDKDKPNMVNCSFGIDVYKTRCFNWISCGVFDEYIWVRRKATSEEGESWKRFESYKPTTGEDGSRPSTYPGRVEFNSTLNNAAYARIISRFPGNNVQFTSHKCIIDFADVTEPVVYEYVAGRMNKDGMPDKNHTSDVQTFTLYPRDYEGRVYQITDQQGFHWIEYQVWAASAQFLNKQIKDECNRINTNGGKVFPIIINTGDASQSGARVNEWLDYYNGGKCLFNHLEHMYSVGNNDLCDVDPLKLGTGNDPGKSNGRFCHYFFTFEVPNDTNLVVKAHTSNILTNNDVVTKTVVIPEDRYIPSIYYFKTKDVFYLVCNSEITSTTCSKWYGLYSDGKDGSGNHYSVNIYTGIEIRKDGLYKKTNDFTPVYETLYSWLNENKNGDNKRIVGVCHEIPFTVITRDSLKNGVAKSLVATRNYPTGGTSSLGCHMNQIDSTENRGIFWFSRLMEYFGCKLVIGGHKHTYALTYPIKEKYTWKDSGVWKDSLVAIKPMSGTLEDEAGATPVYDVSWSLDLSSSVVKNDILTWTPTDATKTYTLKDVYNVSEGQELNSTKLPYIPNTLYDLYGKDTVNDKISKNTLSSFICCTPTKEFNEKYDGFVTYSMCQATGYKLKSNKELPSDMQMFSKIIPHTDTSGTSDSPNANQLYPMYSVIEIAEDSINVDMCRIRNIFSSNGKDTFTQTKYGKDDMNCQYLVAKRDLYGDWVDNKGTDSYLIIKY